MGNEMIPKEVSLGTLQQVLRGLLAEEVPIRDMRTILEALAQGATQQGPLKQNGQSSPSVNELLSRSEEHTSELQSRGHLVCRLLLEKKKLVTIGECYSIICHAIFAGRAMGGHAE